MGTYATGRWLPFLQAQRLTKTLLVMGGAAYLAYDIFAYRNAKNDSISAVSMSEMYGHPAYAFVLGALLGHLTWPEVAARQPLQSLRRVVPVLSALALWDRYFPVQHPVWPIWPMMAGIPAGHCLFPQDVATTMAVASVLGAQAVATQSSP